MATMTALSTVTVGAGGAASMVFNNIPQTYTDLVLQISARSDEAGANWSEGRITFNGSSSGYSNRFLLGTGSATSSGTGTTAAVYGGRGTAGAATANTFGNSFVYIPNYTSSNPKSVSTDEVTENNATAALAFLSAGLSPITAAITSITIVAFPGNLVQYSTATLYGVFSGPETLPSTPTIGTATATGATTATVAFTPTSATGVDASYTALSTPGSITATGTSSPVTVSGLTTGTAYTFQVRANNPGGSSAYSSASNSVTPSTAYESIATTTVGSGGSSLIDFTSIPSTYKHLQIRLIGRTTATNNNSYVTIRFNNDTNSNYASHQFYGTGSGSPAAFGAGNFTFIYAASVSAQSAAANLMGSGVIDILDYASTVKNKTLKGLSGSDNNTTGFVIFTSGLWVSTTAISSIQITTDGTSFAQNSQFALYGIRGA